LENPGEIGGGNLNFMDRNLGAAIALSVLALALYTVLNTTFGPTIDTSAAPVIDENAGFREWVEGAIVQFRLFVGDLLGVSPNASLARWVGGGVQLLAAAFGVIIFLRPKMRGK
jgi:hypothetical protein